MRPLVPRALVGAAAAAVILMLVAWHPEDRAVELIDAWSHAVTIET